LKRLERDEADAGINQHVVDLDGGLLGKRGGDADECG